jgi:hypothetical protein
MRQGKLCRHIPGALITSSGTCKGRDYASSLRSDSIDEDHFKGLVLRAWNDQHR